MPRRPTSTPTPSPSKRIVKLMVIRAPRTMGRGERLNHVYLPLSSSSVATFRKHAVTRKIVLVFLFAGKLLYLLFFATLAEKSCWPEQAAAGSKGGSLKRRFADFYPMQVNLPKDWKPEPCPSNGKPSSLKARTSKWQ